jgi:hypothetical protein
MAGAVVPTRHNGCRGRRRTALDVRGADVCRAALLDTEGGTVATVANVDVFVGLPDGSSWSLTIFTVDEVRRLLAVWRETGEAASGSYFWTSDQVIVPEPGVEAMMAAVRELVRSGDLFRIGTRSVD